jgi:diadenosine tetraphosphate (Ap4A) HIT family hydrolase
MDRVIHEDKYFVVYSPDHPLNCREDGGHLVLYKKMKVRDRSDLTWQEAIDFMRISMMVGKAMYKVLRIERMNYRARKATDASDSWTAHVSLSEGTQDIPGSPQTVHRR